MSHKDERKEEDEGEERKNEFSGMDYKDLLRECDFELFVKICLFFFQIFRRSIEFQMILNNEILMEIIRYFE